MTLSYSGGKSWGKKKTQKEKGRFSLLAAAQIKILCLKNLHTRETHDILPWCVLMLMQVNCFYC